MSGQQVLFGFLEFVLTILTSFFLTFATYKFLLRLTPHFDEEKQLHRKNAAVGLVLGSILVGQAVVVKQALFPVMAVVQIYATGPVRTFPSLLKMLGLSAGYVLIAGILAVLAIVLSFWLFDKLTPGLDQYHEVREGNLAVAVFMALFLVAVCILISSGVSALTRALIPFPRIGSIPLE